MIAEETQKKLSDFLFASKDTSVVDQNENTSNPREPLRDFFMELYCNLELVGITPDIMRSVVKNVYQAIITSTAIIPNHEVKSKYVTSNKIPNEETFDVFLVVSCLIRLYITQFNNFVKNKMEKEHEK